MLKPIRVPSNNPPFDFDAHIKYYTDIHKTVSKLWEKLATAPGPNDRVPIFDAHQPIPEIRMDCHLWDADIKDKLSDLSSDLSRRIYYLKCAKAYHLKPAGASPA